MEKTVNPRKVYEWKGRFTEGQTNVIDDERAWLPSTVVQALTVNRRFDPSTFSQYDQIPKQSSFPGHCARTGDVYKLIQADHPFWKCGSAVLSMFTVFHSASF
jgi:hypothetical protein